jgi:hypothetical protein
MKTMAHFVEPLEQSHARLTKLCEGRSRNAARKSGATPTSVEIAAATKRKIETAMTGLDRGCINSIA